ncbi:MAG: T9SS type A sorting domain-containing protein, partial [Bacteroidota bacterium]
TYNSPGTYAVTLKVQNSLGSDSCTKTCYLEVFQTADIKEKITNSFFVYPNPANNFISVAHSEINQNEIPLNILDAEGKTVLVSSIHQSSEQIDISTLPRGIYILRLMRYGVASLRFIKQ